MKPLFIFALLIQAPYAFAETFSEHLKEFSKLQTSQAIFVETWHASYLKEPLITKGKLSYVAPEQLIKTIETPELIVQKINGDQLTIVKDGKSEKIRLAKKSILATGIYALKYVLNGNEVELKKIFNVTFEEQNKSWKITLVPRRKKTAKKISSITLKGIQSKIQQVDILYRNGNSLSTEISHGV